MPGYCEENMMKQLCLALVLVVLATPWSKARAATQEDNDLASEAASIFKVDENNHYDDNLKMREARKIGVGAAVGGTLGLYGFNLEINFEDEDGVVAGFGGGAGYNSVAVLWKHVFEGDTIAPYTTLGYSRWYNSYGTAADYKNSPILDRALTDSQKQLGRFGADFASGSVGLQYAQLNGAFAGTSLYAEIVLLMDVDRFALIPTGGVGAGFYF